VTDTHSYKTRTFLILVSIGRSWRRRSPGEYLLSAAISPTWWAARPDPLRQNPS